MEGTSLLALPEGMQIDQIQITEEGLIITVVATHPTSCCPLCSELSLSIHSHYRRILRDAPCSGRRIQLFLTLRKFYCRNPRMPSGKYSLNVSQLLWNGCRQDDEPVLRADHLHWEGLLRQRWYSLGRSAGNTNDSPNDSPPDYESSR